MARGKALSEDIRQLIIDKYKFNKSYGEIAKELNLSRSTIQSIIENYKKTGCVAPKTHEIGRKSKLTARDIRALDTIIKKDRRVSVRNLAMEWSEKIDKHVGREWTRIQLHKLDYNFYKVWLSHRRFYSISQKLF